MEKIIEKIEQMPFNLSYYITPFRQECINLKCGKLTDRIYQFVPKNGGVAVESVRACSAHCAREFYKRVLNII